MTKFVKTKQRQQRLERVVKGYNEMIRRAAARKSHGHMPGVVLPKVENAEKLLNKIQTREEYEELINRMLETKIAVYREKTIQLGEYTTIETQTTRQIKKQQQRSIQAFQIDNRQ